MKPETGSFGEAAAALREMAVEAAMIEQLAGGPVTEVVAAWLAPQYALAARRRLAAAESEAARLETLRMFVQDWALLRAGDQAAERLRLERERLVLERLDSQGKFKRKTIVGLEAFLDHVKRHPEARAAFDALAAQLRHPFDPDEQPPASPPPSPSSG
ncbi:MAG: hypothetical protein ACKVYV_06030 [Limisphaerales bacterium]